MRIALQSLALVLAVAGLALWTFLGANLGWTKTQVPVKTIDPVTEIEQIEWQKKFLPGVDFLAVALLGAGVLFGSTLFLGRKPQTKN